MKYVISILIIVTSLLNAVLASNFKRINYVYGLICYILMGLVSYANHIYGMFFFYIFIFSPLQIYGYIKWKKNTKSDKLIIRSFSKENRVLTIISCIIISLSLAFILKRIPNARFRYLDAFSNIINLCGVILLALSFNESWWLWLINNIIDVILWKNVYQTAGVYSFAMLLSSIIYLIVNLYGIYKWNSNKEFFSIVKIEKKKQIIKIAHIINTISSISYFILFNWIGFLVSIFDILISLIDSIKIKKKILVTILGFSLLLLLLILPIKKTPIDYLPLIDLFLYSLIPIIKNTKYIRIIGLINITLFTIFDLHYHIYNIVILDIFILILFVYQIIKNHIIEATKQA